MKITGKTTMKITRKIAITAMAASMACTLVPAARPMTAQAAAKDVTKTLKDRSKVKKMNSWFMDWAYFQVLETQKTKTKTYNFSSAANRRGFLKIAVGANVRKYDFYGKVPVKYSKLWSKRIFGCSTSGLKRYNVGEWGAVGPSLKKTKIYKLSAKNYQVISYIYENDDDIYGFGTRKVAKLTVNLSKKSGSYFGYISKSAKIYIY